MINGSNGSKGSKGSTSLPLDVILVNAITLLLAFVAALRTGNREFVFYIAVMVVLIALVLLVHQRAGFSVGVLRCLTIWAVLHMAGGLVPVPGGLPILGEQRVLYSLWIVPDRLKYDQLVHAFGFGVVTWAFWQGLSSMGGSAARPTSGAVFISMCAALGCGALNEVVEFAATQLLPSTNVGGYENTGWDLVANTVGATIAGALIRIRILR